MILTNHISHSNKIIFSTIVAMIWIYYRTFDCYSLLPRKSILSVSLVGLWTYYNYQEPLLLPIGLAIMYVYSIYRPPEKNILS